MNRRFLCASALSLFVPAFAWAQPEEKHGAPGGGHPHEGGGHGGPPPGHGGAPAGGGHMERAAPSHAAVAHEHAAVHEHAAAVHERAPVHERAVVHEPRVSRHERAIGHERALSHERAVSHERAISHERAARHASSREAARMRGRERAAAPVGPYRIGQGRPAGFRPIRARPFRYPQGWRYRRWAVGAVLPALFLGPIFIYDDYWRLGLGGPPYGYVWVRFGPDLLLVDRFTGRIVDVIYGAFFY